MRRVLIAISGESFLVAALFLYQRFESGLHHDLGCSLKPPLLVALDQY